VIKKNTNLIYFLLVLAVLIMLIAGGVLAYVFFQLLQAPVTPAGPESEAAEPAIAYGADGAAPDERALRTERLAPSPRRPVRLGPSGRVRKYDPTVPGADPPAGGPPTLRRDDEAGRRAMEAFAELPLRFEEDCKAYGGIVDFRARGGELDILVNPGRICLHMRRHEVYVPEGSNLVYRLDDGTEVQGCTLDPEVTVCIEMEGIRPGIAAWRDAVDAPRTNLDYVCENFQRWHRSLQDPDAGDRGERAAAQTADAAADTVRYFRGAASRAEIPELAGHASVEYADVYPGIDLTCYADRSRLEYVFTVWPGADPETIELRFSNTKRQRIDANGNLVIDLACGRIVQLAPRMYQVVDDIPRPVPGGYELENGRLSFRVEGYERERPLVISPSLDYLSFLGGGGSDRAYHVTVDNQGFAYVVGESLSPAFGAGFDRERSNIDLFVSKFRVSDARPVYTAFIGGMDTDRAFGIAADDAGNAYVCGETLSQDFPATNTTVSLATNRSWNAFVTVLDPLGKKLLFSSAFGGSDDDRCYGIALDDAANIYLGGETSSGDLPVQRGFQRRHRGNEWDGFVARINRETWAFDYTTYLGGGGNDSVRAVAVDARRNVYVAGSTSSADLRVENARQPVFGGGRMDGFAARILPGGLRLGFLSYLGGGNDDRVNGIGVDGAGNVYLVGETASGDFPVSENALQAAYGGGDWDAFVTKLTPDGSRAVYSTLWGGRGDDRGFGIDADASGAATLAGATTSRDLPAVEAVQPVHAGGAWDGFVATLSPGGRDVAVSTYVGGAGRDELFGLAVDGARSAHFAGSSTSRGMTPIDPLQTAYGGGESDAYVGRLLPGTRPGPDMRLVSAGGQPGGPGYDFFMSRCEITNEEFVRFLNDAQANTNNARGRFCYSDANGNLWFNPARDPGKHEMFVVHGSRIVYDERLEVGSRYAVTPQAPPMGGSYSNHPVVNVSWYGAVKYCNWLTLDTGRGPGERCYREGTNTWDWAPLTAARTNWQHGIFLPAARRSWLAYKGFRLPMDHCDKPRELETGHFAVSNEQFARFLNDAEAHPATARGGHMVFDAVGNVFFNAAMERNRHAMFRIAESRLVYDPTAPPGRRYAVTEQQSARGVAYDEFPVSGVTCQGAAKYCNWLTLVEGMSPAERCYREGTNAWDWAPVTVAADEWRAGRFSEADQDAWRELDGVRMPLNTTSMTGAWVFAEMAGYTATGAWANAFNEFYKAGAWNGATNTPYGFGRRTLTAHDANYLDSGGLPFHDTTPVGFYNGSYHADLKFMTRTNENRYGIYDLSGNVTEWLTDPGVRTSPAARACYGGSWLFDMPALNQRFYVHPHFTDRFRGFRVVSTATNQDMFMIRIPYRICLCGRGVGPGCAEAEKEEEEAEDLLEDEDEGRRLTADTEEEQVGVITAEEEEEEEAEVVVEEEEEGEEDIEIPEASPSGM